MEKKDSMAVIARAVSILLPFDLVLVAFLILSSLTEFLGTVLRINQDCKVFALSVIDNKVLITDMVTGDQHCILEWYQDSERTSPKNGLLEELKEQDSWILKVLTYSETNYSDSRPDNSSLNGEILGYYYVDGSSITFTTCILNSYPFSESEEKLAREPTVPETNPTTESEEPTTELSFRLFSNSDPLIPYHRS